MVWEGDLSQMLLATIKYSPVLVCHYERSEAISYLGHYWYEVLMMILWIGLIICTSVIVYAGTRLSKYGDIIAEKTGLGKTWIGVILMASVTSLPELVTGISSVTYAGVPDIAVGDVIGSCVFNMSILAILDAVYRPMPVSAKAHHGNILSAGFGILLLSIVAISLFLGNRIFPLG